MAKGITITPYQPTGAQPIGVPGGGYQQIDARAGDFGQSMAAGLRQGGQDFKELSALLEREQAKDDETAALSIDNQYRERSIKTLADPENGFMAKRGRDALEAYKGTVDDLTKSRDELLGLAKNENQKRILMRVLNARLDSNIESMSAHTRVQRAAFQDQTYAAGVEGNLRDAVGALTDGDFMQRLAASETYRRQMLTGQGASDDVIKNELTKLRGKGFKGRLELMMGPGKDPNAAAAWYEKNKGGFDPFDRDEIESKLTSARQNWDALRTADGFSPNASAAPVQSTPGGQFNVGNIRAPAGGFRSYATKEDAVAAVIQNARAYPRAFNNGEPMPLWDDSIDRAAARSGAAKQRAGQPLSDAEKIAVDKVGRTIAGRWAPYGDGNNDPWQWAATVSTEGGVNFVGPLDLSDPKAARNFAKGVHIAEHGRGALFGTDDYQRGADKALGGVAPQARSATSDAPPEPRRADYQAEVDRVWPAGSSDPVARSKGQSAMEAKYAREHAAWKDRSDAAADNAVAWVANNPGQALEAMPQNMWRALDDRQQIQVRDFHKKAGQVETDLPTWWQLKQMATSNDPDVRQQLASIDPLKLTMLSTGDRKEAMGWVAAARNGDDKTFTKILSADVVVKRYAQLAGLDTTPKDTETDKIKDLYAFQQEADRRIRAAEHNTGKPLDADGLDKLMKQMVQDVATGGGVFGGATTPRWKLQKVDDLSSSNRTLVRGWSQEIEKLQGGKATDADLIAGYAASKQYTVPSEEVPQILAALRRDRIARRDLTQIRDDEIGKLWLAMKLKRERDQPRPPVR